MNEVAMKGLLKVAKTMISPAQIKQAANSLLKLGIDYKRAVPINKEAGEDEAVAMLYEINDVVYVTIAIISNDNKILRFEMTKEINELIDLLIIKM